MIHWVGASEFGKRTITMFHSFGDAARLGLSRLSEPPNLLNQLPVHKIRVKLRPVVMDQDQDLPVAD